MAKTIEIEAEQHEEQIDSKLLSLIEDNITEIRNSEIICYNLRLISFYIFICFVLWSNYSIKQYKTFTGYLFGGSLFSFVFH